VTRHVATRVAAGLAAGLALGCAPDEPDFGKFYSADFSQYFVADRQIGSLPPCKQGFTVNGKLTLDIYGQSGDSISAEGRVDIAGFTDNPFSNCRALPSVLSVRGFIWGDVGTSASNLTFDANRFDTDTRVTHKFTFVGKAEGDSIPGKLSYTATENGTGGFTIDIVLKRSDVVKFDPPGRG
jgi:hypothetical protein